MTGRALTTGRKGAMTGRALILKVGMEMIDQPIQNGCRVEATQ